MQGEESGTTHETWISSDFDDVLFGLGNDVYNQEPIVSKRYGLILCRQIPCFRVLIISRCWLFHTIYKIGYFSTIPPLLKNTPATKYLAETRKYCVRIKNPKDKYKNTKYETRNTKYSNPNPNLIPNPYPIPKTDPEPIPNANSVCIDYWWGNYFFLFLLNNTGGGIVEKCQN